jgi:hypothetical protein
MQLHFNMTPALAFAFHPMSVFIPSTISPCLPIAKRNEHRNSGRLPAF